MAYYYKWSNEYIENLDIDTFTAYLNASYVLQLQDKQDLLDANLITVVKTSKIKEMLKDVQRKIKSAFKREISPENMAYLAQLKAEEMIDGQ